MLLNMSSQNINNMNQEYKPSTTKLIKLLESEDFLNKKLTRYAITNKYGYPRATVNYHYLRLYDYVKFKKRYLSTGKNGQ